MLVIVLLRIVSRILEEGQTVEGSGYVRMLSITM